MVLEMIRMQLAPSNRNMSLCQAIWTHFGSKNPPADDVTAALGHDDVAGGCCAWSLWYSHADSVIADSVQIVGRRAAFLEATWQHRFDGQEISPL